MFVIEGKKGLRWQHCGPNGEGDGQGAGAVLVYSTRELAIEGRGWPRPIVSGLIRPLWPIDINEVEEGGNFFLLDKETQPELFTPAELRRERHERD